MKTSEQDATQLYALKLLPTSTGTQLNVQVEIVENHAVFDGHFPGLPILPGVYLIQMIKDSLNSFLPGNYRVHSADTVKFLLPVEPGKNNMLRMEMTLKESVDKLIVTAISFLEDNTIHFKYKGEFVRS